MAKIYTALVAEDITTLAEQHKLLPGCHFGGRPGHRTTDSMHLLLHRIKQAWRNGRVASVLFLDIEGAFPNAVKDRLLHNMRKRRVPEALVRTVGTALTNRHTTLRFDDFLSNAIPLRNGIGQGDPMSMIVYLFYNADILEVPRTRNELAVAYVDDSAFLVEGPSFDATHATLKRMMNRRGGAFEWSAEHNSKFEVSKFALVDFSRKKDIDRPPLRLRQTTITPAPSHKFLGVIFDQELRWNLQVEHAVAKASKWVSLFRRIARNRSGLSAPLLRRLYKAVAVPKATYAADVWFTPILSPPGAKKRLGSVGAANRLTRVQRQAALAITGCFRTTATDYAEAHANLVPIELLLKDLCLRAITRMVSLDDEHHPLTKVVRHSLRRPVKRHPSPIHTLARLSGLHAGDVAPPPQLSLEQVKRSLFRSVIPESREASIEAERSDQARIKMYTDGSSTGGGVGASAALFETGQPGFVARQFHLGSEADHTSYEAELVGALMATHLAATVPPNSRVSIYVDNQATLKAITSPPEGPGAHIITALIDSMKGITSRRPTLAKRITFRWISSHSGVEGNETADRLAKEAAAGKTSPIAQLPGALARPLPKSVTALRGEHRKDIAKEWTRILDRSPRRDKLRAIDPSFHPAKFHKLVGDMRRGHSSLVNQFRSGHVALNFYLHRVRRREDPHCDHCPTTRESIRHYLFECPEYRASRRLALDPLGRLARDLPFLLSTKVGTAALQRYVASTERFKPRDGVG